MIRSSLVQKFHASSRRNLSNFSPPMAVHLEGRFDGFSEKDILMDGRYEALEAGLNGKVIMTILAIGRPGCLYVILVALSAHV